MLAPKPSLRSYGLYVTPLSTKASNCSIDSALEIHEHSAATGGLERAWAGMVSR